jgi:phosphatidylinositol alpha-mannosyltransferase
VVVGPGEGADRQVGRVVAIPANGSIVPLGVGRVAAVLEDRDVVHVHEPLQPLGWAALGSGRATVATFHADVPSWARAVVGVGSPFVRRRLRRSVLTAVSDVAAAPWERLGLAVRRVPNGLDLPAGLDTRAEPGRVVFVGRDEPRKGLDVLLDAWPQVLERCPGAELVLVGTDRDGGPGTRSLGVVAEPVKWTVLAGASVACAPNLGGESFGIVLVEAMAAGCAVVASDLPAFRAVVGSDGVFVPPGDPEALAAAIERLLGDETACTKLGEGAARRARGYRWEVVGGRYERAYVDAIRQAGDP